MTFREVSESKSKSDVLPLFKLIRLERMQTQQVQMIWGKLPCFRAMKPGRRGRFWLPLGQQQATQERLGSEFAVEHCQAFQALIIVQSLLPGRPRGPAVTLDYAGSSGRILGHKAPSFTSPNNSPCSHVMQGA